LVPDAERNDADGATTDQAGQVHFRASRIGDYSATSPDPFDDFTFWTVQQFADPNGGDVLWRTTITMIRPRL
jgi:hypothetical protein